MPAVVAVEEDDHQTIERRVPFAAVVEIDELRRVRAWRVRVDIIDHDGAGAGGGAAAVVKEKVASKVSPSGGSFVSVWESGRPRPSPCRACCTEA